LFRVAEGGGDPIALTTPEPPAENEHVWPSPIPGTNLILFVTAGPGAVSVEGRIAVLDLQTGDTVRLELAGSHPRWSPSRHIVYASEDGSLRAVGFDVDRRALTSGPVPVVGDVGVKASGAANFDVARDGRLVYSSGSYSASRTLAWVDREGREETIAAEARTYFYARVSPDGRRLSLDVRDEEQDIWILDLARGVISRLTDQAGGDQYGLWTPDGNSVVFSSSDGLYRQRADGTGAPERLTTADSMTEFPNAVSSDGRIVYRAASARGANDLFLVSLDGDRTVTTLLATEHDELNAAISPDGKWMAYQSNLSGREEVYVRPFPDVDTGQWTVSNAGGTEPAWSPDGREIFYLSAEGRLMSVPVDTSGGFSPGVPVALFDATPYFFGGLGRNYDVAPDGTRFVMVKNPTSAGGDALSGIVVVLNWAEELRARVR
jgi:Tol biopolymer transport system component